MRCESHDVNYCMVCLTSLPKVEQWKPDADTRALNKERQQIRQDCKEVREWNAEQYRRVDCGLHPRGAPGETVYVNKAERLERHRELSKEYYKRNRLKVLERIKANQHSKNGS